MKDDAVKQLKDSAVDQAMKAIRNRVDQSGRLRAHHRQARRRQHPRPASRLLRSGEGEGADRPHRAAPVQDRRRHRPDGHQADPARRHHPELGPVHGRRRGAGLLPIWKARTARSSRNTSRERPRPRTSSPSARSRGAPASSPPTGPGCSNQKQGLTGEYITDARVAYDNSPGEGNRPYVQVTFNRTGADLFGKLTKANVKRRMAIVLDDTVDSAPIVQTEIPGGVCSISLGGLRPINEILDEAKSLSLVLRSGALPAPVRILEERSVGASLGPELVRRGSDGGADRHARRARLHGALLPLVRPGGRHRAGAQRPADVAVLASFNATLTLPGIAGFVLTLGMAVDANVLINERIREELADGKSVSAAVARATARPSRPSRRARHRLVAGFVLAHYGTGPGARLRHHPDHRPARVHVHLHRGDAGHRRGGSSGIGRLRKGRRAKGIAPCR